MLDALSKVVNYLGYSNLLTLISLVIGVTVSYYFYFKTFYRLVYSKSIRICKNCREVDDWKDENSIYHTRFILYNNGRKTLRQGNIDYININCNQEILDLKVLQKTKGLRIKASHQKLILNFDYLDTKRFIVIELKHRGHLTLSGRTEVGEILNTEPRSWLIINAVVSVLCVLSFIFSFWLLTRKPIDFEKFDLIRLLINLFVNIALVYLIISFMRLLHSLFFIPDKLVRKYLQEKDDKWNSFSNEF